MRRSSMRQPSAKPDSERQRRIRRSAAIQTAATAERRHRKKWADSTACCQPPRCLQTPRVPRPPSDGVVGAGNSELVPVRRAGEALQRRLPRLRAVAAAAALRALARSASSFVFSCFSFSSSSVARLQLLAQRRTGREIATIAPSLPRRMRGARATDRPAARAPRRGRRSGSARRARPMPSAAAFTLTTSCSMT